MSDAIPIHSPSPAPFSRDSDLLTVREFELFRESQSKLEGERQLRMNEAALAAERYVAVQLLHLKAETEAKFVASEKALALASIETAQHLRDLNGEQGRILADRDRSVSRDTYDAQQKEFGAWRDQVNKYMSVGQGRDKGIGLSWSVVLGSAGFLFGLVSLAGFIIGLIKK